MHGIARPDRNARTYRCSQNTFDRGPDRCECPRVQAESLEATVWQATHAMLIDPERLLGLAGLANNDESDPTQDLATITRKITRIETALGSTIADLLARGTDPAALGRATRQLEDRLTQLNSHRDRLRQWNATHSEQTSRARRLIHLADTAKSTLDQADDRLKRTIIDLLDIRVRITGTIPCRTCDGRGLVPASRATQGQGLGRTGQICPTCHRFRRLPKLEIAGAIPDTPSLDNSLKHNNVLPFTLNPAVNRR